MPTNLRWRASEVPVRGEDTETVRIMIPPDASGKTIHLILAVTDSGQPPLTRYRRIVINAP